MEFPLPLSCQGVAPDYSTFEAMYAYLVTMDADDLASVSVHCHISDIANREASMICLVCEANSEYMDISAAALRWLVEDAGIVLVQMIKNNSEDWIATKGQIGSYVTHRVRTEKIDKILE